MHPNNSNPKITQRGEFLLLSEDHAFIQPLITILEKFEIHAKIVPKASLAWKNFEEGDYPLVVVDVDSCSIEATDLVTTIRKSYPDCAVIAVATDPIVETLVSFIRSGIYDFLKKPVDENQLASTIRFACQKRIISEAKTEVLNRLRSSTALLDRNQMELYKEAFRINDELQNLNKALKRHVSQLTILYQMGRDISENENWSDALDRFLMALVNYMNADGAALLLFSNGEQRVAPRSSFQVDETSLETTCAELVKGWKKHPRSSEIHSLEGYKNGAFDTCLERARPWRITLIPLKHRNRALGFLLLEKSYRTTRSFKADYPFLNTIQTIFAEEVANAAYISELRQLSRFNEKVLDNINSGVLTTDTEGNIRFFNKRAKSLCQQLRETKHIHFDELFRSRAFGKDFFSKIVQSSKDSHFLDIEYLQSENVHLPARLSTTKMHDDSLNGNIIVAIFEDLTEQKRLEAEIRKNDRLRALGQLSAGVAHEIRNPLTGIATSVEVLGNKLKGEKDKVKYILAILDEINRLDGIIRNLLNFSRPAKPRISACFLPEISKRVLNLLHDQAQKKGVVLAMKNKLSEETCSADPNQITQVLLNIVLNAIQACEKGDRVEVFMHDEVEPWPSGRKYLRIDVIDSGPGIPESIRNNLFDPFITTKAKGTGLGLAISQQIIEEHSGKILCDFQPGETKFSILLPAALPESILGIPSNRVKGS